MRRRKTSTIIVSPNVLLREGLARILADGEFRVSVMAEAIADVDTSELPGDDASLLLFDSSSANGDGIAQIEAFKSACPTSRVAVLADGEASEDIHATLRAGANGYFCGIASSAALVKSLELVMLGEDIVCSRTLASSLSTGGNGAACDGTIAPARRVGAQASEPSDPDAPRLSPREIRVLKCLVQGDSNKRIARKIDIAESTVKVHIKTILRKIRVENRTKAAVWAMNNLAHLEDGGTDKKPCANMERRSEDVVSSTSSSLPPVAFSPSNGTARVSELARAAGPVPGTA